MKTNVSSKHCRNTKDLASTTMKFYCLGLKGTKKDEFAKTLDTFIKGSELQHHCVLCIRQVNARQQTNTQLL
jgi:uncharacterized UBP type Zn finger protein